MHYSSITILCNPNSTGDSKSNAEKLQKTLTDAGLTGVELLLTNYSNHAEDMAYKLAKATKNPLIISSSGDGGYNEVINGALKAQAEGATPTTSLLPSGNANDHYKQLHEGDTAERILNGHRRRIDVLKVTATAKDYQWDRYAHSYIGFGVSPEIGKELNKAELNETNDVLISLKGLLKSKPFTIIQDGTKREYQSVVMSNIAKMSKVLGLAKDSEVTDGLFEVFALPPNKAFMFGVLVKSATIGLRYTQQTDHYDFKTIEDQPVQCDGEVFDIKAGAKVSISIDKQALNCII